MSTETKEDQSPRRTGGAARVHGTRVDLLVTDVGLPGGLSGRQVADAAHERRPGLPVLFITGYAGGALGEHLAPGIAAIGKPFALDALTKRVGAMLEARHYGAVATFYGITLEQGEFLATPWCRELIQ